MYVVLCHVPDIPYPKGIGQILTILTRYSCNQGYLIIQISCTYEKLINPRNIDTKRVNKQGKYSYSDIFQQNITWFQFP